MSLNFPRPAFAVLAMLTSVAVTIHSKMPSAEILAAQDGYKFAGDFCVSPAPALATKGAWCAVGMSRDRKDPKIPSQQIFKVLVNEGAPSWLQGFLSPASKVTTYGISFTMKPGSAMDIEPGMAYKQKQGEVDLISSAPLVDALKATIASPPMESDIPFYAVSRALKAYGVNGNTIGKHAPG